VFYAPTTPGKRPEYGLSLESGPPGASLPPAMIGEIPDVYNATLTGDGGGGGGAMLPAVRDPDELILRELAGRGGGLQIETRYGGGGADYSNPWAGAAGWGSMSGRVPPALIMSTAALRCRVVILDNLAKARPYIRDADTKKEYTGEFADRLAHPMGEADPYMSLKRWVTVNVSAMLEQGDAHVWRSEEKYLTRFARNGKSLRRAYIPLPVGCVEPQAGKAFWKVDEWIYSDPTTGQVTHIPPEEMARIEYLWNPRDYFRGIGPMEAAKLAIETDYWYALQARNRQIKGGLPALLLMNQRAGTQDQELKAFLGEFRRQMADERGGVAGLGSDWKVERLSMTAQEADEINSRRYQVEEVARAHGIPLIDLNVYESTGFGREGMAILNRMRHTATIQPLSERFADGVTQQIVAEIDPGLEFAFDWSTVKAAQDDMGEAIDYAARLFALGVPMEECARITALALEDYEGKDLGFLASSLLTMEEIQLRAEKAKNPPEPPPQLVPPQGKGALPDFGAVSPGEPPPDELGPKKMPAPGDRSEGTKDQGATPKAALLLEGARFMAAAVLSRDALDELELRARRVGLHPAAFDRLIAKSTTREVEASIAFQKSVNPYAKKIQKTYETGVNKAFKTVDERLWKLQKKRPKVRLLAGEPEPEGTEVFTDSKGHYYFGAVDPTLVDPLVENIGLDSVIDEILDEDADAYDEGIDSMEKELRGLGYVAPGAIGAAALTAAERRRAEYLDGRRGTVEESMAKVAKAMLATIAAGFLAGEAIRAISRRLMRDLRPTYTGGSRVVIPPPTPAGIEPPPGVPEVVTAPGRGQLWGDQEAYDAANAGRRSLAGIADDLTEGKLWWRWLTMEDDRVRPAHEEIHSKAVRVGTEFIAGSNLTYPGDPAADPDLTINCRCWTTLLTPEEVAFELAD
jgi:phage portal protein BeeE